ncbi:thioredoxin family protein [Flavobacteriaceae bacterium]|nr:thioredoxin family protein [Flavobacteriaceae bacterium]
MARTPSVMIPLGFKAPAFELLDVNSDEIIKSEDLFGIKGTLIMFICNHCPFVKHINEQIVQIANDYKNSGIKLIAISSNDIINYPEDSPVEMKKVAIKEKFIFPYLFDETQIVAKSYDAACTPDFFIFNNSKKLVYRGQLDDSRPGNNIDVTGIDIRNALDSLINLKEVNPVQKPSIGCNIKWKN